MPLERNIEVHADNPASGCEARTGTRWAAAMFWLAVLFLVVVAWLISLPEQGVPPVLKTSSMTLFAGVLWILFIVEAVGRFLLMREKTWSGFRRLALVVVLPPFRMGVASDDEGRCLWLPWLGWQPKGQELYETLERAFSLPMVFIALLILPILALEFFGQNHLDESRLLTLVLHHGTAVIWLAFAMELVLLASVAENKLKYCLRHWLNILIVLLPVIAFLRSLQLLRMVRVTRMARLVKVFRVRGVLLRAWRALVVLDVVERLTQRDAQKRLVRLRADLAEKEYEVEQLRERIRRTEEEVARTATEIGAGSE